MGCKSTAIFSIIKNIHLNFWEKPDYFPGGRQRSSGIGIIKPIFGTMIDLYGRHRSFYGFFGQRESQTDILTR